MIYGYAKANSNTLPTSKNSLQKQIEKLNEAGAEEIFSDVFTDTSAARPQLATLVKKLNPGDTIVITGFDKIANSLKFALKVVDFLKMKGVKIHVLNYGLIDESQTGGTRRNVLALFAEWEKEMVIQRTSEGKQRAKHKPGFREGRPMKFSQEQERHALELLKDFSYAEVSRITGISKATLSRMQARENKKQKL